MDAELAVAPPGCSHLGSFKVDNWKQNLRAIYQCFVWSGTTEARKRKVRLPGPPAPLVLRRAGAGIRDGKEGKARSPGAFPERAPAGGGGDFPSHPRLLPLGGLRAGTGL